MIFLQHKSGRFRKTALFLAVLSIVILSYFAISTKTPDIPDIIAALDTNRSIAVINTGIEIHDTARSKVTGHIRISDNGELEVDALDSKNVAVSMKVGGAMVSEKHANFIIAEKDCKSSDVMKLIDTIREKVKERFDTELELEIEIWN